MKGGYLAVDCFFIISGFFVASKIFGTQEHINLLNFACSRYKRLMPEVLFITFIFMALNFNDFFSISKITNILTMTNSISLGQGITGGWWYVSTLFWTSIFICFIKNACKNDEQTLIVIIIFMFMAAYLFYQKTPNSLNWHQQYINGIPSCFPRSILGLGTGLILYHLIKSEKFTLFTRILENKIVNLILKTITLSSIITLFVIPLNNYFSVYMIYPLTCIFILTCLSKSSVINNRFKFNSILINSSYFSYLSHVFFRPIIESHGVKSIYLSIFIATILSLIGYILFLVISKFITKITARYCKL